MVWKNCDRNGKQHSPFVDTFPKNGPTQAGTMWTVFAVWFDWKTIDKNVPSFYVIL
jgi:hypothetical protein